ncbi:N-acetylgalactosamine-N, N'-diacetylbacillosaminyl-diphospho-undecaprenol 4-alpha-N-acetylgalactosaminyltransferase [Thalassocella blandensis]|nr:N-acetylgalactosamine-N, N'-diacetylbacillosaminyl-diphospho-undecaprenol 4-alpha-N-acetylgalactosaminyltransferase [Thalassocella blandensis]
MQKKVSVLMSFSGAGGVERMVMNLVRAFAEKCEQVDLLVIRDKGPHFADIPKNVNIIKLNANHTLTAIPAICRYLKAEKPESLLVAKDRAGRAAVIARALSGVSTKIYVRLGTNLSTALEHRSAISAWWRKAPMKVIYRRVDKVIAVSRGVAEDTIAITGIPEEKVCVIRNPVVTEEFLRKAEEPTPHEWLSEKQYPVIIGVGRLSVQKDFETLIKAFNEVNKSTPCRLIILGEGGKRQELEALIASFGLQDHVLLPGFQSNPMSWVKAANVFVLSSRWEGSPNALTEALALGVPSVSTRCPSGPDETLAEGKFGPLVEMGDFTNMARQILRVLENPLTSEVLKSAVAEYHVSISADKYLDLMKGS